MTVHAYSVNWLTILQTNKPRVTMSFDVLEGCLDPDYMVVIKKLSFSIVVCKREESSLSSVF